MQGNIIVDGVVASCYASVHQDIAHIVMTPIRKYPWIMEWIFGVDDGFQIYMMTLQVFGNVIPASVMH